MYTRYTVRSCPTRWRIRPEALVWTPSGVFWLRRRGPWRSVSKRELCIKQLVPTHQRSARRMGLSIDSRTC